MGTEQLGSTSTSRSGAVWTRLSGLVVVFVWSTCFVAIRGTEDAAPPLLYAAMRALVAAAALAPLALATGKAAVPRRAWGWLAALAFSSTTLGLAGMFLSVGLAGAALPAVLANSQALFVAPMAAWWLAEPLTRVRVVGLALGFAGVALTLRTGASSTAVMDRRGLYVALVAAVGLAVGNVVMKKLSATVDGLTAVTWQYALGGIALLAWSAWVEAPWAVRWTPRLVGGLAYLGLVLSAGASWAWYRLLQRDRVAPLTALTLLGPAISVALAWLLFGEPIGGTVGLGILVALIGTALASVPTLGRGEG